MFYVYCLKDPREDVPFYIGKGTGRRASTHLWNIPETRNQHKENKIKKIRDDGLEPEILMLHENIADEVVAYDIETALIKKYGRKGYERDGILTNVCIDSRPPNHKRRTYVEIYGSEERAKEQIEMRRQIQLERGGFGPKKFSKAVRERLSLLRRGENSYMFGKTHSKEMRAKIGAANKKYIGEKNVKSKCYKITSPSGDVILVWAHSGIRKFCEDQQFSFATFAAALQYKRFEINKGKAAGWKIEYS